MKSQFYLVMCLMFAGMMAEVSAGEPQSLDDKQPPKVLQRVPPVYPAEAKAERVQGKVTLEAVINEKGDVVEVKEKTFTDKAQTEAEKATGPADPRLVKAATDAVKQWKYEPYKDASGKVQTVRFSVTVNFKLR